MSIYVAISNDMQQINKSNNNGKQFPLRQSSRKHRNDALTHVVIGCGVGPSVAGPSVGAGVGGVGVWQLLHLAFMSLQ